MSLGSADPTAYNPDNNFNRDMGGGGGPPFGGFGGGPSFGTFPGRSWTDWIPWNLLNRGGWENAPDWMPWKGGSPPPGVPGSMWNPTPLNGGVNALPPQMPPDFGGTPSPGAPGTPWGTGGGGTASPPAGTGGGGGSGQYQGDLQQRALMSPWSLSKDDWAQLQAQGSNGTGGGGNYGGMNWTDYLKSQNLIPGWKNTPAGGGFTSSYAPGYQSGAPLLGYGPGGGMTYQQWQSSLGNPRPFTAADYAAQNKARMADEIARGLRSPSGQPLASAYYANSTPYVRQMLGGLPPLPTSHK